MKPNPRREHSFEKSRGPWPADGNAKCKCGKRLRDPIHGASSGKVKPKPGKKKIPPPPPEESFMDMLRRHEKERKAAELYAKRMAAERGEGTMTPAEVEREWKRLLD